jgi:hypothetical protein
MKSGYIFYALYILFILSLPENSARGQIAAAVVICAPLAIGGVFLMRARDGDAETESEGKAE